MKNPEMKRITFYLAFCLILWIQEVVAAESQPRFDMRQIMTAAPVLNLAEDAVDSYEIEIEMNLENILIGFRIAARKPDKYAVMIFDPCDDTPILVTRGEKILFYDPTADELFFSYGNAAFQVEVTEQDENNKENGLNTLFINFEFNTNNDPKKLPDKKLAIINLHSILQTIINTPEVHRINNGYYRLTGKTVSGGKTVVYIQETKKSPMVKRIDLYRADSTGYKPAISFRNIKINGDLPDHYLDFPMEKLLASDLELGKSKVDKSTIYLDMMKFYKAILARFIISTGIIDQIQAGRFEKLFKQVVDWEKVKTRDRLVSNRLKVIFEP